MPMLVFFQYVINSGVSDFVKKIRGGAEPKTLSSRRRWGRVRGGGVPSPLKKVYGQGAVPPPQKFLIFFGLMCSKNFCVQAKGGGASPSPPPPKYATGHRGVTSDLAGNGDIRNFARSLQSVPRSTLVCCHQLRERSTSTVCAATCNLSDDDARGSFHGKSSKAVGHRRSSYLRSFANNSVTETRVLYRISNNRITRQPLTFPQKRFLINLEDTGEKALAQYWDDVERSTLIATKERMVLASAHFLCTNCNQEALLLQKDCTTRYNIQNLVNCCTNVGTRSTTNPYEIEVMQLEHCGRHCV